MNFPTKILAGACVAAALMDVHAQQIQQVDTHQQRRQRAEAYPEGSDAPALYPDESSDAGPQSVLRIKPRKRWFEAMADVQFFYTDNLFLSEEDKHPTDVLVSTAEFAFAPTPCEVGSGTLAPRVGYRHQWFDFGLMKEGRVNVTELPSGIPRNVPISKFDFNAQTFFADIRRSRDNWVFDVGFNFTRLMSTESYDEFYKEYVPHWGVQRIFPVNDQMAFAVGYAGNYRFTDTHPVIVPAGPPIETDRNRMDHALFASWTYAVCPHAALQPYYQFKFTRFTDYPGDRNDQLHSLGLGLFWTVCPNFEVRAFTDYNLRESDNPGVADYRQLGGGGGVNVTFRF